MLTKGKLIQQLQHKIEALQEENQELLRRLNLADRQHEINGLREALKATETFRQSYLGALEQSLDSIGHMRDNLHKISQSLDERCIQGRLAQDQRLALQQQMAALSHTLTQIRAEQQHATQTVEALLQISQDTGNTLRRIRSLADQTTLIALHAAIEATRAGKHGTDFTLVAEEVRRLSEKIAQASNHATVQLKQLETQAVDGKMRLANADQQSASLGTSLRHHQALVEEAARQADLEQAAFALSQQRHQLEIAKFDQLTFKLAIYQSVLGIAPLDPLTLSEPALSLSAAGANRAGPLEHPLSQLYEFGRKALQASAQKDYESLRFSLHAMELSSIQLHHLLDQLPAQAPAMPTPSRDNAMPSVLQKRRKASALAG